MPNRIGTVPLFLYLIPPEKFLINRLPTDILYVTPDSILNHIIVLATDLDKKGEHQILKKCLGDMRLEYMKKKACTEQEKEEEEKKDVRLKLIDKTSKKYKALLELVNKILKNIGNEPITDLLDFKNIDRVQIIKDKNRKSLLAMENNLFGKELFSKTKIRFRDSDAQNWVLNVLRALCKDINLSFEYIKKDSYQQLADGRRYRRTTQLYSIC